MSYYLSATQRNIKNSSRRNTQATATCFLPMSATTDAEGSLLTWDSWQTPLPGLWAATFVGSQAVCGQSLNYDKAKRTRHS